MKNYTSNTTLIKPFLGVVALLLIGLGCSREYSVSDGIKEVEFKATASSQVIGVGESVTFIDSSLNVASRRWIVFKDTLPMGERVTSDQKSFDVIYDKPSPKKANGDYLGLPVILQVTFNDGRVQDNDFGVAVHAKISLDFETNLDTAIAGSTINFTNLSMDFESQFEDNREEDTFMWEFPGGSPETSMEPNPSVIYSTAGTYPVTITAFRKNPEDSAKITKVGAITIVNELALVPDFTADNTEISADGMVTFSDASTGGADTYNWTFPGGTPETSTEANPVVTYSGGGFYDVTLEVTRNADSTTESVTKPGFVIVDSPFCNTPENLVGCGNNDGEGETLVDWTATLNPQDDPTSEVGNRKDRISISTDQAFEGDASILYSYSEPGAPAFTDVFIDYNGKNFAVTEAGSYTVSMQTYGVVTNDDGNPRFVFNLGILNSETGGFGPKEFKLVPAEEWTEVSITADLQPGIYSTRVELFNPGFNAAQSVDMFMDNITVVRN